MTYDDTVAGLLQRQRAFLDATNNNRGRVARVSATWTTIGGGEIRVANAFPFNVVFIEEPSFTSGVVLADGAQLVEGHFPRVHCGVFDWRQDKNGYYTGAYVYFVVDVNYSTAATSAGTGGAPGKIPNYEIHHHLRWEGTAIKTLPDHLLDF